MIVTLGEAVAGTCGGKAGALGALLRAGLPVPDGFVVPFAVHREFVRDPADAARREIEGRPLDPAVLGALTRALGDLGDPPVAVRSSAAHEDTGLASAAGQHESFLAVRGTDQVADAVRACWASLFSPRAVGYRGDDGPPPADLAMAVLVQRLLDADVSGVMFTPGSPDEPTEIEASWGLGPSVVGGTVTPDAYRVAASGQVTARVVADKRTRLDRRGGRLVTSEVPADDRRRPTLDDATATRLAELGARIAGVFGGPQDIEWAIADGRVWILQSRPITAALPTQNSATSHASAPHAPTAGTTHDGSAGTPGAVLSGTPGSRGSVTGAARIVRGPADFARVRPGDVLVCPFTDPAWTPLLRIAAGVVTETGGVLSHAAIVAREYAIPAVLGIPDATRRLRDDTLITVDGSAGTVTAGTITTGTVATAIE
ncbi:pyruvate, phosphate dikinase [Nonomuraea sp. NN258]|nr:pyruvate, phosphate dikinase [Nonomuraea antri]